jgi:hypothetical protein
VKRIGDNSKVPCSLYYYQLLLVIVSERDLVCVQVQQQCSLVQVIALKQKVQVNSNVKMVAYLMFNTILVSTD